MRHLSPIIILSFSTTLATCQSLTYQYDSTKIHNQNKSYFLELLGNGFLYSLNFDKIIFEEENLRVSRRFGFTYLPYYEALTEVHGPGFPFELNLLFGKRSSFLELGIGATYFYFFQPDDQNSYHFLMENLRLGYRYQKAKGGFFFRIALVPIATFPIDKHFDDDGWIIPYFAGISIGFTKPR